MEWESYSKNENDRPILPASWLYAHYFEAMNILFRVENSLRVFVFAILKRQFKEKWLDIKADQNDSIKTICKRRSDQTKSHAYLGYNLTCPMMFLTTGELLNIIKQEKNWPLFKPYFLGSKSVMENKLDEIVNIRNSFAHFRPVKEDDIEVLKQNSKHTLILIEDCLGNLFQQNTTVPTNTKEEWYKELRTVGTDRAILHFRQSEDEEWISIEFKFTLKILAKHEGRRATRYTALNIKPSAILSKHSNLAKNIIYLSERLPFSYLTKEQNPEIYKSVTFVFPKNNLSENWREVKEEIERLLSQIVEESDLITQDNLAKGDLVETSSALIRFTPNLPKARVDLEKFKCKVGKNDPPEYWGDFIGSFENFISNTEQFPWMPAEISNLF